MIEDFLYPEPDTDQLVKDLESLDLSIPELAHRLRLWGDYRKPLTITRSIQRMKSKEIPISGEMRVIINMLLARQEQTKELYADIQWTENGNKVVSAMIDSYKVDLNPYTKGRWVVNVTHPSGYCPPWPIFPKSLAEAKQKALIVIEDTRAYFATNEED